MHTCRKSGGQGVVVQAKHWLRNTTRVWSYNSQYMDNTRARHMSYAFAMDEANSIVGIQGTQQKYKKGDFRVEQWSTEHHDVWELRQKQRGEHSHPLGTPGGQNPTMSGIQTKRAPTQGTHTRLTNPILIFTFWTWFLLCCELCACLEPCFSVIGGECGPPWPKKEYYEIRTWFAD